MNRNDVTTALETALTSVLDRPVTGLEGNTRLFDDLHLDSTTMLASRGRRRVARSRA